MTASLTTSKTRRSRWTKLVWLIPLAVLAALVVVLIAMGLRSLSEVRGFIESNPGQYELPAAAPVGFPAWLGWQHFLNSLFILLIIRTGWQVRTTTRPAAYWTRRNTGVLRTRKAPAKISLNLWLHLNLDALWVLNGIVFFVLLFATGQWMRIVPTDWAVFPNALSAALQYASLDWPTENGWVNYNSLQVLSYFVTTFIAAPLAIVSGLRMSSLWPSSLGRLSRAYPIEVARAIHLPVMLFFVGFVIVHVTLVLATGALRNLNHMYGGRDDEDWVGFWIFAASLAVMVVVWVAARPVLLRPLASLTGKVSR